MTLLTSLILITQSPPQATPCLKNLNYLLLLSNRDIAETINITVYIANPYTHTGTPKSSPASSDPEHESPMGSLFDSSEMLRYPENRIPDIEITKITFRAVRSEIIIKKLKNILNIITYAHQLQG